LVRHGTTAWVDNHILHGITDIPLNEIGLHQAQEAAKALKSITVANLYSSPLKRCLETAQIIGMEMGLTPKSLDGLKELNFGWLEGRPFRDHSSHNFGYLIKFIDQFTHQIIRALTGESLSKFQHRITTALNIILEDNPTGTVVIVGHSAVFNQFLIRYFGKNYPKGQTYYAMTPGSINEIILHETGTVELARLNDITHQTGAV
jgi:broad specificity phosphatase PhoE